MCMSVLNLNVECVKQMPYLCLRSLLRESSLIHAMLMVFEKNTLISLCSSSAVLAFALSKTNCQDAMCCGALVGIALAATKT